MLFLQQLIFYVMAKSKTVWYCKSCGAESLKWMGMCPSCGEWNTMVEAPAPPDFVNAYPKIHQQTMERYVDAVS